MRFTAPVRDDTIPLEEASDVSYVLVDATSPSFSPALFANSGVCLLIQGEQLKDIAWSRKQEGGTTNVSNEWDLMFCYLVGFPRRAEQYHAMQHQFKSRRMPRNEAPAQPSARRRTYHVRTHARTKTVRTSRLRHSSNVEREPWQNDEA